MSTYGTMQTRIAREIVRTDLTTEIQDAIQSAIAEYESRRFWFNENTGTVSTVASTGSYSLPSDCIGVDVVTATVNGRTYPLERISQSQLEDIDTAPTTTTGQPVAYTIRGDSIRLYPVPDGVYTVTLYYHCTLVALSGSSDTNAWVTHAEALIRARAKRELYEHRIMDDERAAVMAAAERRALSALDLRTSDRIATGRVRSREW